ncbi:hypothetical protein PV11_09460 [Exophiala sideris]|uniref:Uncharacterized protein n=1 Tax=Exophiala sideris TaxID=1016849 RepID=A0A0D1WRG2_9EURO|nr:hypothetical protein PV11_09460 [Exophiala sideris]
MSIGYKDTVPTSKSSSPSHVRNLSSRTSLYSTPIHFFVGSSTSLPTLSTFITSPQWFFPFSQLVPPFISASKRYATTRKRSVTGRHNKLSIYDAAHPNRFRSLTTKESVTRRKIPHRISMRPCHLIVKATCNVPRNGPTSPVEETK